MTTPDVRDTAALLVAEHDDAWIATLIAELDRGLATRSMERLVRHWELSGAELGGLFGVSRQAVAKWLTVGVPADRAESVADVQAIAQLLDRYLKEDLIPVVVRRQAPGLGGRSLIELISEGRSSEALRLTREMLTLTDARG